MVLGSVTWKMSSDRCRVLNMFKVPCHGTNDFNVWVEFMLWQDDWSSNVHFSHQMNISYLAMIRDIGIIFHNISWKHIPFKHSFALSRSYVIIHMSKNFLPGFELNSRVPGCPCVPADLISIPTNCFDDAGSFSLSRCCTVVSRCQI